MSEPRRLEETSSPALAAVLRSARADAPRHRERELRRLSTAAGVVLAGSTGALASSSLWLRRAGWLVLGSTLLVTAGGMWWSRARGLEGTSAIEAGRPAPSTRVEVVAAPSPPARVDSPSAVVSVDDLPTAKDVPMRRTNTNARTRGPAPSSEPAAAELPDELSMLDAARSALAAGQPTLALDRLAAYHRTYPQPSFDVEGDVLEIQALAALGQTDLARAKAQTFLRDHPGSPYEARVRTAATLPPR